MLDSGVETEPVHQCETCHYHEGRVMHANGDLRQARVVSRRASGNPNVRVETKKRLAEAFRDAERELTAARGEMEDHRLDCEIWLALPPRPETRPGFLTMPKKAILRTKALREVDLDAVHQAVLTNSVEPAAPSKPADARNLSPNGRCHGEGCDRPVSGERKFCGRCLARRHL